MPIVYERMGYQNPENFPPPVVQSPWQRHHDWVTHLNNAEKYVAESTMFWLPALETDLFNHELMLLAKKGTVSTNLHVGAINGMAPGGKHLTLFPKNPFFDKNAPNPQAWKQLEADCNHMRESGVHMFINNPPRNFIARMFPHFQTDHRKVGVVDTTVGWFKDFNKGEDSYDMLTYAIRFMHPPTVQALKDQIAYSRYLNDEGEYIDRRPSGDLRVEIPGQPFELLMDRGDPGKSVMMDSVLLEAKRDGLAIHASQYPISGRMSRAIIERSKRGQDTIVVTSDVNCPELSLQMLRKGQISGRALAALKWKYDTENNPYIRTVFHDGYVHSKAFLVLNEQGVFGIVGTNNFNEVGIIGGTQEYGFRFFAPSDLACQLYIRHLTDVRLQNDELHMLDDQRLLEKYPHLQRLIN